MNVLLIGINYYPEQTGIAPYTATMAAALSKAGHRVRIITGVPHYPQWRNYTGFRGFRRDEAIDGVLVRRVRHRIAAGTGVGRILQELSFGVMAIAQPWGRLDVVILVSPPLLASALALLKARARRVPVGVWTQDLYSLGMREIAGAGLAGRLLSGLETAVLDAAQGTLVIHDRFKRSIVGLGVDRDKVTVCRNWTHLAHSEGGVADSDLRRRLFGDARTIALHTGNMGAKQGLSNVIDAAREADQRDCGVVFGLVGDGSQRDQLLARAAGIRSLVFIPPLPDEDYRALLQLADVLIVNEKPGLREMAVPSKLTSYFLQGKPVVAAVEADSTTAEEVRAAGAGPVVDPGDPTALLLAVDQVATDEVGAEFGASARRFAEQHLQQSAALARFERWLVGLVDHRRAAAPNPVTAGESRPSPQGVTKCPSAR